MSTRGTRDGTDGYSGKQILGGVAAGVLVTILIGAIFSGVFWPPPQEPEILLKGEIVPVVEGFPGPDTTDIDAAGTYEFWATGSNPTMFESALTWGTHTQTTIDYQSLQSFTFVCKSTTTNAFDHYSWVVTLPTKAQLATSVTDAKETNNYHIEWDAVNDRWDITFYAAQEAQPTMLVYTMAGVDVGTTAQDLSNRDYVLDFEINIAIAANYDALGYFWDPEEGTDGEWDHCYIIVTCNVSAANAGWTISGGTGDSQWKACSDGKSYYMNIKEYIDLARGGAGLAIRWDEQQEDGVLIIPIRITSSDIDTSGAGAALFTLNFKECQDPDLELDPVNGSDKAKNQAWESDTLTNLHTAVTAETITVQD